MTAGAAPVAVHTLDEAAAILRVKPSWLERQAAAHKIPFTMLAGSYRFTPAHLAEIIRMNEHIPCAASDESSEPERPRRRRRGSEDTPASVALLRPRTARPRHAA